MGNIFDLLGDSDPVIYRTMVLEFGIQLDGKPHWRCQAWGGPANSVEEAQDILRQRLPDLEFCDPPEPLDSSNLGDRAYRNKWNAAFVSREDTGQVVSVGWLTQPPE